MRWLILVSLPLLLMASCATQTQMALDAEVRRLCAIDGGIRVYEQVKLPAEEFDKYSKRNWILPTWEQMTLTDNYYVERETHYYRKGSPEVAKTVSRILRRSDGKVLGEYIRYGRGGGDLPGPWHGSYYLCPDPTKSSGFETKIFIKGE
ncbi:hypothetical protein [Pelomicrobium sp. G1]|uniref:hypothetical protein n=1 Tax=Pelomicrobium sp. G1 TaxID=3452920 RepID=UPI003F76A455